MKFWHKKLIFLLTIIILFTLFIKYILSHWSQFAELKFVNPWLIVAISALTILFSYTYGIVIKYLLSAFNVHLKFKEHFGLSIITGFYNIIAPLTGGVVPRALYLKKKHNFKYRLFISSLSGMYITHFLVGSILGIISLLLLKHYNGNFDILIFSIFVSILVISLFLVLFSPKIKDTKIRYLNFLIHAINGWHTIRKNKKVVFVASLMAIIQTFINLIGIMLAFDIFDIKITLVQAFFLSCTGFLGGFVVVTPGIIGLSEIIAVFASSILGITVPEALAVALLSRAISTITILILGPIYSGILLNHYHKGKNLKKNKK